MNCLSQSWIFIELACHK